MSSEESTTRRLANEQRKRLVAKVLNHAEQSPWWRRLSRPEQVALREKLMDAVGVYHDFILDLVSVSEDGVVRNEHALTLIQQVHERTLRIERKL